MARGALVRLQARDGFHTSDKLPSLAITAAQAGLAFCSEPSRAKRVPSRASASITGCVRKSLLRLRPSACLTRDHRLGATLFPLVRFQGAAKVPRPKVLCKRSAAHRPRKGRISASRSLSFPQRPDSSPLRKDRYSIFRTLIFGRSGLTSAYFRVAQAKCRVRLHETA
jgi:hypothetical protein